MAIYHLEAKVITRGEGRTACGAAAYMSCARIYNDYDGIQHDYTRKGGLVWEQVFLPAMASAEWQDRETLWNAVEANEKSKDSQLAREFIVALPVELERGEWIGLVSEFIQDNFVSDGMCADVAIHNTDDHNPHAHILLTMRPLDENGKWQYKTEKEYLCVRNGEERGFTAAEFKAAQAEDWEKQYPYKVDKKKVYMTPSAAEAQGLERASKHPKATRYGRQNPITARWNSEEQLIAWRAAWADTLNRALERSGGEQRVDHRSHAERGLDEQPTIHEGVTARALEKQGVVSERCELNRQIREDNTLIRTLKAAIVKLKKAVEATIPAIAAAMETIRQNIIVLNYGLLSVRDRRKNTKEYIAQATRKYDDYKNISGQIEVKTKGRSELQTELAGLSVFDVRRRKELKAKIVELSEEITELQFAEKSLMQAFFKADATQMKAVEGEISKSQARIAGLDTQEVKFTGAISREKERFDELKEQAADLDQDELADARLALRLQMMDAGYERIHKATHGREISFWKYQVSIRDTDELLGEKNMVEQRREQLRREALVQKQREHPQRKSKDRGMGR